MTWGEISQLITSAAAIGAVIASLRNTRKIENIHIAINSRMDQLLELNKDSSFKAGEKAELDRKKN